MRYQGRITSWKDDKGFGFVKKHGDETPVFVHIKAFAKGSPRPVENDVVTFEIGKDASGRLRAEKVAFPKKARTADATQSEPSRGPFIFTVLFLAFLIYRIITHNLSVVVLFIYIAVSFAAFIAYAWDKGLAQKNAWRTPESTLHFLSLACGWPGALAAQRFFRHKNKKKDFQNVFWVTVLLNVLGLALLTTQTGLDIVHGIMGIS